LAAGTQMQVVAVAWQVLLPGENLRKVVALRRDSEMERGISAP
jgi:hypothetical protein